MAHTLTKKCFKIRLGVINMHVRTSTVITARKHFQDEMWRKPYWSLKPCILRGLKMPSTHYTLHLPRKENKNMTKQLGVVGVKSECILIAGSYLFSSSSSRLYKQPYFFMQGLNTWTSKNKRQSCSRWTKNTRFKTPGQCHLRSKSPSCIYT